MLSKFTISKTRPFFSSGNIILKDKFEMFDEWIHLLYFYRYGHVTSLNGWIYMNKNFNDKEFKAECPLLERSEMSSTLSIANCFKDSKNKFYDIYQQNTYCKQQAIPDVPEEQPNGVECMVQGIV